MTKQILQPITSERLEQIIQQHFREDIVRLSVQQVARVVEQEVVEAFDAIWKQADPGGALRPLSPAQAQIYALTAVLNYIRNTQVDADVIQPAAYIEPSNIPVPTGYTVMAYGSPVPDRIPVYTLEQIATLLNINLENKDV